jgi:hypothetical protein
MHRFGRKRQKKKCVIAAHSMGSTVRGPKCLYRRINANIVESGPFGTITFSHLNADQEKPTEG